MTVKNRVTIVLQNGHSLQPMDMVAGTPDQGDVAVIKVRPQRGMQGAVEKFLPTSGVQVGDVAWAIGYYGNATSPGSLGSSIVPLGGNNTDAPITQPGEVSNLAFPIDGISYLTTNATLGEGMSGGPLVFVGTGDKPDWLGCVIGIDDAYVLPFGPHAQFPNLNLVLPSDSVLPLVKQLLGGFDPRPVGSVGSC
jgi:S1-C subfamily serine protease